MVERLLMSTDTVGGVWSYAVELCRALEPAGVRVLLCTMGAPLSTAQLAEVASLEHVDVEESRFKLEWMDSPWDDVERAGDWLLELAVREGPSVIHLNHYAHGGLPWPAPVLMVGHSDVRSWFRAVRGEEAPPEWERYRSVVQHGLQAAAHVVAPTRSMLASLVRDYGPFRSSSVIGNARDATRYFPTKKGELVMAAGRLWDDAKNLQALERAAPRLRWPVAVAGPVDHPDGGRRRAEHVHLLGTLGADEMASLYAGASIYALPARYEPFGLSVLEAALSGCALVLGDIPSLRELWDGAALFVPPDDTDALVAAIDALVDAPAFRAQLQLKARTRGLDFQPARMAAEYLTLYRKLVLQPSHASELACG